jgi:glycosyltransferase involved in cell wall biosynthesis
MACGLPVILTPSTGANDYVKPGINGSVVPIRDPAAIALSAEEWWHIIRSGYKVSVEGIAEQLSFQRLSGIMSQILSQVAQVPGL